MPAAELKSTSRSACAVIPSSSLFSDDDDLRQFSQLVHEELLIEGSLPAELRCCLML